MHILAKRKPNNKNLKIDDLFLKDDLLRIYNIKAGGCGITLNESKDGVGWILAPQLAQSPRLSELAIQVMMSHRRRPISS